MPRSSWLGLMGNPHCPPTQAGGAGGGASGEASVSRVPVSRALARRPLSVHVTPSQTARTSRHVAFSASSALERVDCLLWLAGGSIPPAGGGVWRQALFAGLLGCSPHEGANTTAAVLPGVPYPYGGHGGGGGGRGTMPQPVRLHGVQT